MRCNWHWVGSIHKEGKKQIMLRVLEKAIKIYMYNQIVPLGMGNTNRRATDNLTFP